MSFQNSPHTPQLQNTRGWAERVQKREMPVYLTVSLANEMNLITEGRKNY